MPTFQEMLDDRKAFPDDNKITMADGVETTLGDIRSGYMKDADYRQKTSKLAREREDFTSAQQRFAQDRQEAEAQLAALVEKAVTQNAPRAQQVDEWQTYLERDPVAKRLASRLEALEAKLTESDKKSQEYERRLHEQQQALLVDQHRRALAAIKSRDPDLQEQDLVAFARENAIPRLDLAYRLFTEDKRMKVEIDKVKESASKEAYEKAKRELAQPAQLPSRRIVPTLPEDAPKSMDDAFERASRDPEILATMEGLTP